MHWWRDSRSAMRLCFNSLKWHLFWRFLRPFRQFACANRSHSLWRRIVFCLVDPWPLSDISMAFIYSYPDRSFCEGQWELWRRQTLLPSYRRWLSVSISSSWERHRFTRWTRQGIGVAFTWHPLPRCVSPGHTIWRSCAHPRPQNLPPKMTHRPWRFDMYRQSISAN